MHIGKRIENLFDKTDNLTKKSFAKSIGVTEGYIYKIFEKSNINTDLLCKISKALNISPAYFFENNGKPEDYQVKDKPGYYEKMEPANDPGGANGAYVLGFPDHSQTI